MSLQQPTGLCDMCIKLATDPGINCPIAQAIREVSKNGVVAHVVECPVRVAMENTKCLNH